MMPTTRDELGRIRAEDLREQAERARRGVRRHSLRRAEPRRRGER